MYRLSDVLASEGKVAVVEGEKCADAVRRAWPDQVAVTWVGGTNAWTYTDWQPLAGREVTLVADADPPGHEAMTGLASHLAGLGCAVKLALPPVEWDSDVADWLEAEGPAGAAGRIAELVQDYAADLEPTAPQPLIMPAYVGTVDLSLDTYRERTLVRSKNSRGLKDALDHLGIAYRWNKRAVKFELELGREQAWEQINDRTRERIRELLGHSYRYPGKEAPQAMHFSSDSLKAAFGSLLYDYEEDPFLTWLEGLHAWDNQPRLRSWLGHVFVVNEYHELCDWSGVYMLLAPVWRAYHPGLKMDEVPVLIGRGGMGKSTAVSYTLPHGSQTAWFSELNIAVPAKERVEATQGRVLVELGDMAGATKAEKEELKAYISKRDDGSTRLAYRHDPEELLRRFAFVGTADNRTPLPNDKNLRRWVPVSLDDGNPQTVRDYLDEHRDQLWGEALALYRQGVEARLPERLYTMQEAATADARSRDIALEDKVRAWVNGLTPPRGFTLASAAEDIRLVNSGEGARLSNRDSQRLATALRHEGYDSIRGRTDGSRKTLWYPA